MEWLKKIQNIWSKAWIILWISGLPLEFVTWMISIYANNSRCYVLNNSCFEHNKKLFLHWEFHCFFVFNWKKIYKENLRTFSSSVIHLDWTSNWRLFAHFVVFLASLALIRSLSPNLVFSIPITLRLPLKITLKIVPEFYLFHMSYRGLFKFRFFWYCTFFNF